MSTEEQVIANYYFYTLKYLKNNGIIVSGDIGLCNDSTGFFFKSWPYVIPEPTIQDLILIGPNEIKCVTHYYTKCIVNIVTELETNCCISTGAIVAYDNADGNGLKLYVYNGTDWVRT